MARVLPAALLALPLSACSLLLGFDGELIDAAPVPDSPQADADPLAPDAPPDPTLLFEPNNTSGEATPITPGTYGPIAIKPMGDHDFFAFSVADTPRDVTIDVLFITADGDLDVELLAESGMQLNESAGFSDNEHILRTTAMGGQLDVGNYYIDVFGFNNQQQNDSYMLVLTVL
jgi:hypothetical protein